MFSRSIAIILLFVSSNLLSNNDNFSLGNNYLKNKEYSKAIEQYQTLVQENLESFELYYNLGIAYYNDDQLGKAILYFEKAKVLNASDKNLQHNLEVARDAVETEIIEIPDFVLFRFWRSITSVFTPMVWLLLLILFSIISVFTFLKWRNIKSNNTYNKHFVVFSLSITLSLFFFLAGLSSNHYNGKNENGIVMKRVELKSAPDLRSETYQEVSEGVKAKVLESLEDWYKVELLNKDIGWIQMTDIAMI